MMEPRRYPEADRSPRKIQIPGGGTNRSNFASRTTVFLSDDLPLPLRKFLGTCLDGANQNLKKRIMKAYSIE
jgi:hypothetical protein